ncbi:MAG: glycosyltransferase family 2 protein, partial [bacterium]|nr:glycosyltransferase family 2 protein [bacterium]
SSETYQFEILVIDNGSQDASKQVITELCQKLPGLRLISHKSYGKGWAVKQGMLEAKGDFRLFTDADNSTDIAQLDKLLPYALEGYDVVISSRRIEGSEITRKQPWHRQLLGDIFAALVQTIVPLGIKDTQNGFKLFGRKVAEDIFPRQSMYFWAFDIEILAMAKNRGYKIKEVPITWINADDSKMNFKGMVRMLFEVINIRLMLLMNK